MLFRKKKCNFYINIRCKYCTFVHFFIFIFCLIYLLRYFFIKEFLQPYICYSMQYYECFSLSCNIYFFNFILFFSFCAQFVYIFFKENFLIVPFYVERAVISEIPNNLFWQKILFVLFPVGSRMFYSRNSMYAWLCGPSSPVRPLGRMVREECLYRLNDQIVSNNLYSEFE